MYFTFFVSSFVLDLVVATGCLGPRGDSFCRIVFGGSYCKYWKSPPVCHGSNMDCQCSSCSRDHQDAWCESISPGSYCKTWKNIPVCHRSNIQCSCESIDSSASSHTSVRSQTTSSLMSTSSVSETIQPSTTTTVPTTTGTTSPATTFSTVAMTTTQATTTNAPTTTTRQTTTAVLTSSVTSTSIPATKAPMSWPPKNLPFQVGLYSWVVPDNLYFAFLQDPANVISGDLYIQTDGSSLLSFVEQLRSTGTKAFGRVYAVWGDNTPFTDTTLAKAYIEQYRTALLDYKSRGAELGKIGISLDIERAPNHVLMEIIQYAKNKLSDIFDDFSFQIAINGATAVTDDSGFYAERGRIADEEVDSAILMSYRNFVSPGDGLLGFLLEDGDVVGLFNRFPGLKRRTTTLVTVEGPADGSGEGCHPKITYGTKHAWKKPEIATFGRPDQIINDFREVSSLGVQGLMQPGGEFAVHQYSMFRCFLWDFVRREHPEYNMYVSGIYGNIYSSYADLMDEFCPPSYYKPCEF